MLFNLEAETISNQNETGSNESPDEPQSPLQPTPSPTKRGKPRLQVIK
jgi:hypothetical protein